MRKLAHLAIVLSLAMVGGTAWARLSDEQVRRLIVEESINSYPGNCPCPFNTMRNGARCGGRSAYSRPGGYAPKCFPSDVKAVDIMKYRAVNGV